MKVLLVILWSALFGSAAICADTQEQEPGENSVSVDLIYGRNRYHALDANGEVGLTDSLSLTGEFSSYKSEGSTRSFAVDPGFRILVSDEVDLTGAVLIRVEPSDIQGLGLKTGVLW